MARANSREPSWLVVAATLVLFLPLLLIILPLMQLHRWMKPERDWD
jgi:hypothetical protein